jgi:glucosamine-phosphate N-acetyltransferase
MEYISLLELIEDEQLNVKSQYIQLLSYLTATNDLTIEKFNTNIKDIFAMGIIIVCILRENNQVKIVGSGTIIIEPKIIHNGKCVGHIEDVVVHPNYRNQGIAQTILDKLVDYSKKECYKVILNCTPNLEQFYNYAGFEKKCIQMALLHPLHST